MDGWWVFAVMVVGCCGGFAIRELASRRVADAVAAAAAVVLAAGLVAVHQASGDGTPALVWIGRFTDNLSELTGLDRSEKLTVLYRSMAVQGGLFTLLGNGFAILDRRRQRSSRTGPAGV